MIENETIMPTRDISHAIGKVLLDRDFRNRLQEMLGISIDQTLINQLNAVKYKISQIRELGTALSAQEMMNLYVNDSSLSENNILQIITLEQKEREALLNWHRTIKKN